ncbi:DUF7146 domain-containing protein [Microbaculum marinum]|uniref:Toprim domain-containing protein n=1 Tax=Microbaculum marinum TaxID=1764581 RepID=A0AAW9RG90_9HYPH
MTALRDLAKGRWPSLLGMLGIDRRFLNGRHGPCPICEGGRDRFRFDDKDGVGSWICSVCGAGDGFALLMRIKGWDFAECAREIEAIVGKAETTQTRRTRDERSLRDAMNRLWSNGKPIERGDPVAFYLECRGLDLSSFPPALRFVERCRYQEEPPTWHPAMIAKVLAPDGKPVTLHRTYLDMNGKKAAVEAPRRLMPGKIVKGCAIRLGPAGDVLGVAEGIETALSAAQMWSIPVWAAINAGMLMAWEPPEEVKEVIVFGDNDESYAGQSAAYALGHRLAAKGWRVSVAIPPQPGDWNDVLQAKLEQAA